jgi:hypothetical protein
VKLFIHRNRPAADVGLSQHNYRRAVMKIGQRRRHFERQPTGQAPLDEPQTRRKVRHLAAKVGVPTQDLLEEVTPDQERETRIAQPIRAAGVFADSPDAGDSSFFIRRLSLPRVAEDAAT